MPSPPKTLDTKIQFNEPITFTTIPAIAKIKVPFKKESPLLPVLTSLLILTHLPYSRNLLNISLL